MDWSHFCPVVQGVPTLACIPHVFSLVVNALLSFVGTASVIMLMYSGIKMILAKGDAKELDAAHKTFFYALIGLILVLFSFLALNLIAYITHVTCITKFGFGNCSALQ